MPPSTEGPGEAAGPTVIDVHIGDRLELRRQHACGGLAWCVVRVGADIGLSCEACGRRVLMPRADVERRFRRWLQRVEHS